MLLQTTELVAELVSSSAPQLVAFAIGSIAGSMVPTYYAQERLRGFGRAMISRLPYQAPPGVDRESALEAAVEDVNKDDVDGDRGEEGAK